MKQLTFDDVCKQLKKNNEFNEISDGLSALSGAAILLLGIRSANGDISAFLNALTIKDELVRIGSCILDKIIKDKSNEYDKRIHQIQWAYSMIYYTAFFDVLDEQMPLQMRKSIALSLKEKETLFQNTDFPKMESEGSLTETRIFFPNIVYGYQNIEEHLQKLYESMCEGLIKFVHMLSFEETNSRQTIAEFNNIVNGLPQLAVTRFKSQYLYLASHFNEFYIYMQLEGVKNQMVQIEELYQKTISIGCNHSKEIDVGLEHLENVLLDLPEKIREDKVNNIVNAMIEKYKNDIGRPIIDSKNDDEKLKYPSIHEAFIPQSYKLLEYTGSEKLEKKKTWAVQKECHDMDSFWTRYYVSHHSLENLLLILGEPGGGKSLLTKIICARMSDHNNIFVRIPLREVSVEKEIEDIVCEQIQKDGDASERLPTFKWFAENFKYNPITLVFDGYDEVLQATGGVYRNLLKKILKFQEQCAEKHRPVRVVVTSREMLIDKADIPTGTIVLKLLEFNEKQREEWIKIWNQHNEDIFLKEHINPFMLPENNKSIDELSRQPLLLLMLAIYDANLEERTNSLGQEENLNRTKLYNELLRRFIRRELKKGSRGDEVSYEDSDDNAKGNMVDQEMEKLGIAALGMFIRGKLSLKVSEMEHDLKYMGAQTPAYKNIGKMLSNAEELFGSFFFIHDSQSGNIETDDKEVAFEFLHKTFYEFLVADVILKYLIRAVDELAMLKNSKRSDSYQRALDDPNHFDRQYYTAFMNADLCTEPEIIEMIVEWKENAIKNCFQGERPDYDIIIEELFNRQLEMLCSNIYMPTIWNGQSQDNVVKKSYLQYCAAYFMNLLILQVTTKTDSRRIIPKNDWTYISQFWKMNIQEDVLLKFTSLFNITNEPDGVCIKKKQVLSKAEQRNLLEKQIDIFHFLQDDISCRLYRLHDITISNSQKQNDRKALSKSGINMQFEVLLGELNEYILENDKEFSIEENIARGIQMLSQSWIDASLVLDWLLCVNHCLDRESFSLRKSKGMGTELINTVLKKYPENIQILSESFQCCQKIGIIDSYIRRNKYFYVKIEKIIYDHPQLSIEYLDLLEQFMPVREMERIVAKITDILHTIPFHSLDLTVNMLHKLYLFGSAAEANDLLRDIIANKEELYKSSATTLTEILRLCLLLGRMDDAFSLIETGAHTFNRFFFEQPEAAVTFLAAIPITNETQVYVEDMMHFLAKQIETVLYNSPEIAIKVIKTASRIENLYEYGDLIDWSYKRYNFLFDSDPIEAISLLKNTDKTTGNDRFREALKYSLKKFPYLMTQSIEAAMDLLLISCKRSVPNISPYAEKCFNYILFHSSAGSEKALELLNSMRKKDLDRMAAFFGERYLYILNGFPDLAKAIAAAYHNSDKKELFLDTLWVYAKEHPFDDEYILCLKELWQG
ncbi:MAG: hypothetical protein NC392_06380 [Roseburia sp.]|nr:hypothetical protein [Roseburia sp.]MCM1202076.1 hypothetical protein [Bacteroides fragilis]